MNSEQFDRFSRQFGKASSRRDVLKLLLGGAAAITVMSVSRPATSANQETCTDFGQLCETDDECCEGFECSGICDFPGCTELGSPCSVGDVCCGGATCATDGTCGFQDGPATCLGQGDQCSSDEECCDPLMCATSGVCGQLDGPGMGAVDELPHTGFRESDHRGRAFMLAAAASSAALVGRSVLNATTTRSHQPGPHHGDSDSIDNC